MRGRDAVRIGLVGAAVAVGCGGERRSAAEGTAGANAPTSVVEGRVTRASGRSLVVEAPGQAELELRVRDGVEVTFGEWHLSPGAVRPGTEVRASYAVRDGTPTVVAIDVVREGGAWMGAGSDLHRGVSPDLGASAPAHPAQDRLGGSDQGPAATSGGGERSGGAAGGGIHGPDEGGGASPPLLPPEPSGARQEPR
jgi:hypothetical protein